MEPQSAQAIPHIAGIQIVGLRMTATAAQVARFQVEHGRLPTSAEYASEVHIGLDPFDGQPLHYRTTDTGFMIYSVGLNGVDDEGHRAKGVKHDPDSRAPDDWSVEIKLSHPKH